jgi:hypothetical protein
MIYKIIFTRGERVLGGTPWDKGLEAAKQHAKDYMKIHNADRVEVRDDNDVLVFHHPRTLGRA